MSVENYLIYLRKSRADNQYESVEEVLAKHEIMLQETAVRMFGLPIPKENIYREVGSGETIEDRPEIKKILSMIESSNIHGVLVVDPQRLSRGDWEDGGRILSAFKYSNTTVITPTKTYDLHDKYDYKMFKMELSSGNDYLEYYKEIQHRGKIASVRAGNYIGSIAPYGYKKVFLDKKSPSLALEESEYKAIELIYHLFVIEDLGWTKIARKLDELGFKPRHSKNWNPSQIKTILTNIVYTGKIKWNHQKVVTVYENGKVKKSRPRQKEYEIYDGKHPAIVTQDIFDKAQEKLGKNTREPFSKEVVNPLAGLLYCKCGTAMTYRTYTNHGVQRCEPRLLCNNQIHCQTKSSTFESVYTSLIETLENIVLDFQMKLKNNEDIDMYKYQMEIISNLEKELEKLEDKQEELYTFLEDGIYTKEVFIKRNQILAETREELKTKIQHAKEHMPKPINYSDQIVKFESVINCLKDDAIPAKNKNRLLKTVVKRINYTRDSSNRTRWDNSKPYLEIELVDYNV